MSLGDIVFDYLDLTVIRVNGVDASFRAGKLDMFAQLVAQNGVSELMSYTVEGYPILVFASEVLSRLSGRNGAERLGVSNVDEISDADVLFREGCVA